MEDVSTLWVLLAAALVLLMQAGFLFLEAGLTRAKNYINVSVKNILDFGLAVTLFWVVGYGLMFGDSVNGWFGWSDFAQDISSLDPGTAAFWLFQSMFAGTTVTIDMPDPKGIKALFAGKKLKLRARKEKARGC